MLALIDWFNKIINLFRFLILNDILDLKIWYFQTDPPASPKQLHFWDRFLLLMLRYFVYLSSYKNKSDVFTSWFLSSVSLYPDLCFGYLSPSKLECWRPWYLAPLLQSEHYQAKFLLKPYDGLVAVPKTAVRMVHSCLHGSPCESFSILFFIVRPSIWVVIVHCHLASCDGSS